MSEIPELTGDAAEAVAHRGSHLQIIASAGAGKTEVVAQRVVSLLHDGIDGRSIVAFTFSKRAAEELKQRIAERTTQILGSSPSDTDVRAGYKVGAWWHHRPGHHVSSDSSHAGDHSVRHYG